MSAFTRDAADFPQASYRPDPSSEIDTPEDFLGEIADRIFRKMSLSFPMAQTGFRAVVVKVCVDAIQEAAKDGTMAELLGDEMPQRNNLESLAVLLAEIIDADNPRLHAKCIDFVLGIGLCQGVSETQIAHEEGLGKSAVSARCIAIKKAFGLPPGRGMKSEEAVESYSQRQKGKRAKPRPQPWSFAGILGRAYGAA